ncbi:MAG TPA: iron ABC transporter permease [Casimicrobiaceae bacterium]|nr:iron ABC transporter permease [Casimicrobiaceae bacterium]
MASRFAPRTPSAVIVLLLGLTGVAIVALAIALMTGSVAVSPQSVLRALFARDSGTETAIVRELRIPRALSAFATGGLLAIAGAFMQVLLRNPLADPYVLGLSGGAAVAALAALATGHAAWTAPAAFAGALVSTLLVFALARRERTNAPWTATRLLLTGIVIASGWGALIALLLSIAPEVQVRGMLFWLIGDLSTAGAPWLAFVALAAALAIGLSLARDLNVLARGSDIAEALGVPVHRVTLAVHATAALATAAAVTTAGTIGFVGLVVPHALRLVVGNDQRVLIPACAIAGGALLVFADTAARTLVAPVQLPVGVVTALIGVPTFLWLLSREP